jgi:DNA-nicking Smr family endonuclease
MSYATAEVAIMKIRNRSEVVPDDAELFDQAVRGVKRLDHKQVVSNRVQTPLPKTSMSPEVASEYGEELRFLRPGIQLSSLQKLRRGHFPIEATLDLHGLTSVEASIRLQKFLLASQSAGRSSVRIVHGKGHGSIGHQPVLKSKVRQQLEKTTFVLAFCSASPSDGGTGAVDVLLKKARLLR